MKNLLLFSMFIISSAVFSQEDAWVYFKDKPNQQTFLDNPLQMLTQRALDRRTVQGIALDSKDVPIYQNYVDQIAAANGISVMAKSKWLNAIHIRGTQVNIATLTNLSFVEKVLYANHSLNPIGKTENASNKTKIVDNFQETLTSFNYGNSSTQIEMLKGNILHQQNHTGAGKIIAVLDAGFIGVDTGSPFQRLRDNNLILGGYDFVNNTTNPYVLDSHGTNVLSNMGGYVDGQLIGTAPDAQYYLFITEDVNSENPIEESNWVEAAEMADYLGVDVINTSLGYFNYDNPTYSYNNNQLNGVKSFASRGADVAFSRGMICVTSAGNSGNSQNNPYISVPADALTTLTVGAVTSSEVKSTFSSIGPTADGRIKPDVMAMGSLVTVATSEGNIASSNGTSFASPILAGALTSFWSAFPNKKNTEIIQFVKASADRFSNPDNLYGYGIPNFQAALLSALTTTEFKNNNLFKIFPNPASNSITITTPDDYLNKEMNFYNNLGQLVLTKKIETFTQSISLTNLSNGIYFYSIASGQNTIKGKIIKN